MPAEPPHNISSDALEQKEVDKIAAELKQQLDASKPTEAPTPPPTAEPVVPAPVAAKTEDTVELKPGKDDTIFIDRDGQFRQAGTQLPDTK